jgi:putative membrane protein
MKRINSILMIAFAALLLPACHNGSKGSGAVSSATSDKKNDTIADAADSGITISKEDTAQNVHPADIKPTASSKDVKFASAAANICLSEINSGKMAQEKSTNDKVKNFATVLVNDQTDISNELATIARYKGIVLPALPGMAETRQVNQLAMKQGSDFDKAYLDAMITQEEKASTLYQNAARDCQDPELKAFAMRVASKLKEHLDLAKNTHKDIQ